jgi:hypothetical protein
MYFGPSAELRKLLIRPLIYLITFYLYFSLYKCLTCVHFIFSTLKEVGNTHPSVDSFIEDITGRLSDDDFDIRTPVHKGNATVINCYIDIYNTGPRLGPK